MKLFKVEEGTSIKIIEEGSDWLPSNIHNTSTTEEILFELNEMRVDPTGISDLACTPEDQVVGGEWAKKGWYGFEREGYTALVPMNKVEVLH